MSPRIVSSVDAGPRTKHLLPPARSLNSLDVTGAEMLARELRIFNECRALPALPEDTAGIESSAPGTGSRDIAPSASTPESRAACVLCLNG